MGKLFSVPVNPPPPPEPPPTDKSVDITAIEKEEEMRRRQRGRASTILTSNQGATEEMFSASRTLLG